MTDPVRWPGFRGGGLLLPLPPTWFQPPSTTLEWEAGRFRVKSEFHVTLLNRAAGSRVCDVLQPEGVRRLFEAEDWTLARSGDGVVLRTCKRRDGRRVAAMSIIERIGLPGLNRFRARLAQASGIALPDVPPHVTLFTCGDSSGIGLPSRQALEERQLFRLRLPGIGQRLPPPLDEALAAAYRSAAYGIDGLGEVVRIGQRSAAVERECQRRGVARATLVTAFNPYSEPSDADGNRLRQQWLAAELGAAGLPVMKAQGRDPGGRWAPEDSLLVFGATPALDERLLCDYEQHAVVVLEPGEPARLAWHPRSRHP